MTIEKLANITARRFGKHIKSTEYISEIVSKKKGREIDLDYDECIEVFSYSIEVILGESIKMVLMCLIAYFLGVLDITVAVLIGFCSLRTCAGGFHMKTFSKCLFVTMAFVFVGNMITLLMSKYIYSIVLLIVLGLILIYLYAPVGSEEKPIETEERKIELKRKSMTIFSILTVISLVFICFGLNRLAFGVMSGIFVEGITITPIGILMFKKLENILESGKRV